MEPIRRSYEVRLVTPAFIAGADQQSPELRAPSIRGCLRWWFRLARKGEGASPAEIAHLEEEVFGSTEKGQRLILRVHTISEGREERLDYWNLNADRGRNLDHQYLWFPLRPEKGDSKLIARPAIPAGTVFRIDAVIPRPGVGTSAAEWLDAAVSHWVLFGALGMRSRRCGGSLWFASRLPAGGPLPRGKNQIDQVLQTRGGQISSVIELLVSPGSFRGWREAIADAGNRYRGQRKKWRDETGPARGRKALPALGWPIMNFRGVSQDRLEVDGEEAERLASPVMLKVVPDGDAFRWLAVVIKQPFAEQVRSGEGEVRVSDVVCEFLHGFDSAEGPRPGGQQVPRGRR